MRFTKIFCFPLNNRSRGKRLRVFLPAAAVVAAAVLLAGGCSGISGGGTDGKVSLRIGVSLYQTDDTFINNLRSELESRAKEYEQETGARITLDIQSAKGNQRTQNNQVERFISLGCDVLCINPVDRMAVSSIIDHAVSAQVPVVFFNRQPVEEDMNRWDQLYYVGVDAKETAILQGQIVISHYEKHPEAFDRNGDGVIKYVLLEGESSHQDSLIRTEWSIQTLKDAGIPIERLTGGIASWERPQASALVEQWLEEYPGQIELIISNNDDMALGALDAMDRLGAGGIQVVGIDATEPGTEAVMSGRMMGTVSADKAQYARAIFELAVAKARGKDIPADLEMENETYYWCPQSVVNQEDFEETR